MAYLAKLYDPLKTLSKQVATSRRSLASAERAFALLDQAPDVPERPDARALAGRRAPSNSDGVWFAYDGARPVLRRRLVRVPAGHRVGIAGRTGAGKTTLVNLLTRFYDPTDGRVLLDGVDLRDYRAGGPAQPVRDRAAGAGAVLDDIAREHRLRRGPSASRERSRRRRRRPTPTTSSRGCPTATTRWSASAACALSGGERQRISLARAFLKDAPILILDEPTSSVDMKTEARDHGCDGAADGGPHDVHHRPPPQHAGGVRHAPAGGGRPGERGRAATTTPDDCPDHARRRGVAIA